jgi:hypothetical protein
MRHAPPHRIGGSAARALLGLLALIAVWSDVAAAQDAAADRGRAAVASLAGCYLVDYSYTETEALRAGYVRDARVYDVNRDKSVKEWIVAQPLSARRILLHRVLFATELGGALRPGSEIRHQTEDWEYAAPFRYDFAAPSRWEPRDLRGAPAQWTRRVTNLDAGLRYQCTAPWRTDTAYPEWSCANYAPIPGRETRDMGRRDYDALERDTRIVAYGGSWLERQANVKVVHRDGVREPLARELGKNWYVRLPDAECASAAAFADRRRAVWDVLREAWDAVLDGRGAFVERVPPGQPPRFARIWTLEDEFLGRDLADQATRAELRDRILKIVDNYRAP